VSFRAELRLAALLVVLLWLMPAAIARASTYVVYIPLDSPVYDELDTLNGLGLLETYLSEIKPISRVEAARLTLEAQKNLANFEAAHALAQSMVDALRSELSEEIGWLENNAEDNQPSMLQPVQRVEAQYIYSRGDQRVWNTGNVAGRAPSAGLYAVEGTPLLPNNDGIPTGSGSNEVVRWNLWGGFGGFLTAYGEPAITGPFTYNLADAERFRLLDGEAVVSLGNAALSFGQEEMRWGTGQFGALSQGDNAAPFPALRLQNIRPTILPWFLSYLGQFRYQVFFGQLDSDRTFAHPWIDGQIFAFKPLPNFEFGFTHTIDFGGRGDDQYSTEGFFGRATGFATGSQSSGSTNSRAGVFLKFYFPELRNAELYQEILGEDNLTDEVSPIGRFLPFLAVSYQGGLYLPRLTADGMTDFRFEYSILEPNYSAHSDSLYWTYNGSWLMGDAMGSNATQVDMQVGRWLPDLTKASADLFYTERAPTFGTNSSYSSSVYGPDLTKERSGGLAFDFLRIPQLTRWTGNNLIDGRARIAFEYVDHLNFGGPGNFRVLIQLSTSLNPAWKNLTWP
jgi:hypothetical protein